MSDTTPPPAPAPEPTPIPAAAPAAPAPAAPTPYASATPAATPYSSAAVGPKTNTLAIVSLVLAILWISIPAVICGHIAMGQIKSRAEGGKGIAIAGLIVGYLGILGGVIATIIWVSIFALAASSGGYSY